MTTKITYSPVLPRSSLTGTSGYYRDVFADGVLVGEVFRTRRSTWGNVETTYHFRNPRPNSNSVERACRASFFTDLAARIEASLAF